MKRLLLLLCIGFILNACTNESLSGTTDTLSETSITFGLKMPHATPATTRTSGVAKDMQLNEINMLVFDQTSKEFLYGRKGIKPTITSSSNAEFTAKLLMTNTAVTIHLLANPTAGVDPSDFVGKTETELISTITSLELNATATKSLPMYGKLDLDKIDLNTKTTSPVALTRAVARVDVLVAPAVTNFTLQKITAYYTPNKGYWVDSKTTPPTIPTTDVTLIKPASPVVVGAKAIENQLFIYENIYNSTVGKGTRIVVQGEYTDGKGTTTTSYYPIDFNKIGADGAVTEHHVLRNHQYIFNITNVSGLGYDTEEDASKGTAANIKVELIPWDNADMGDIIFDGVNHFTIQSKEVILKGDNVYKSLSVSSNIPAAEWEMKWETSTGDYILATEMASATFNVTKPNTGNSGKLTFSTLKLHAGVDKIENLHIRVAKRLNITIKVNQIIGAQDILTVDGRTGAITDVPLIYHEGGRSEESVVSTGNELVLWSATANPESSGFMTFTQGGGDGGTLMSMFARNLDPTHRTGTITVIREVGSSSAVSVEYTQEGKPTFNTPAASSLWNGTKTITKMITEGSHPDHYEWTATLSNFVQATGSSSNRLPNEQVLRLGHSTSNSADGLVDSDYAETVSGNGGEFLILNAPARPIGISDKYTTDLTVSYKRKKKYLPEMKEVQTKVNIVTTGILEIGDFYPAGSDASTAKGIVYKLRPLQVLSSILLGPANPSSIGQHNCTGSGEGAIGWPLWFDMMDTYSRGKFLANDKALVVESGKYTPQLNNANMNSYAYRIGYSDGYIRHAGWGETSPGVWRFFMWQFDLTWVKSYYRSF